MGILTAIKSAGSGLISGASNLIGNIGSTATNVVGGVVGATTNLVTGTLNTTGGAMLAGSAASVFGGKNLDSSAIGQLTKNMSGNQAGRSAMEPAKKVSFWKRLFNMYKLVAAPEEMYDQNGEPVLNYANENGGSVANEGGTKQLDWVKISIVGAVVIFLIWGIKKLFFPKKSAGRSTSRRRRR